MRRCRARSSRPCMRACATARPASPCSPLWRWSSGAGYGAARRLLNSDDYDSTAAHPVLAFGVKSRSEDNPDDRSRPRAFPGSSRMAVKGPNPVDKYVGSRVRMRRLMLGMSQEKLGDALGLTFQQIQKYEKGANRIGASRLQQISTILQVPVAFFFEGAPESPAPGGFAEAGTLDYSTSLLSTSDGLALAKAFMRIENSRIRRRIVDLVEEVADGRIA